MLKALLLGLLLQINASSPPLEVQLKNMTWKNRVVILFAPEANDASLQQQKAWLEAQKEALSERQIVVLVYIGTQLSAQDATYFRQHLRYNTANFGFWLIGKDGGVKMTETKPVLPQKLFETIDAMPMRRAETRQN
jgi:Domain of unknown function (DUF4174)